MKRTFKNQKINGATSQRYNLNTHIVNLISIAKQNKIESISVPLWQSEYPFIPSLYCNDINNAKDIIDSLKSCMNITLKPCAIYYDEEIKGLDSNDIDRFIPIYVLEINNISRIRYFGVNNERADKLKSLLKRATNILEEDFLIKNSIKTPNISSFNIKLDTMNNFELRNSFYSLLFAKSNLDLKGIELSISSNKYISVAIKKGFLFSKTIPKLVFSYDIALSNKITKAKL